MNPLRPCRVLCAALLLVLFAIPARAAEVPRTAIVSAFPPELAALETGLEDAGSVSHNGVVFRTGRLEGRDVLLFPSGISMINAAMTSQLALDRFSIRRIVFSGIAGGVDPALGIGDVVVAERWGQYLETVFARTADGKAALPPFFSYPFGPEARFGMMVPRALTVQRDGAPAPETRFWFEVDPALLALAREVAGRVTLAACRPEGGCLSRRPRVLVGGAGVSGGAFIDNAAFRAHTFATYRARVLDMESAAVAHVAHANGVPFIAFRSLSDLAGGGEGANEMETFLALAAGNAARVVRAFVARLPD